MALISSPIQHQYFEKFNSVYLKSYDITAASGMYSSTATVNESVNPFDDCFSTDYDRHKKLDKKNPFENLEYEYMDYGDGYTYDEVFSDHPLKRSSVVSNNSEHHSLMSSPDSSKSSKLSNTTNRILTSTSAAYKKHVSALKKSPSMVSSKLKNLKLRNRKDSMSSP